MDDSIRAAPRPCVDVVLPVYNEEHDLEASVRTVHAYLAAHVAHTARITIVDNASVDRTPAIGARLANELDGVRCMRLEQKGRGRALRAAWLASDAEIVAYMDVDLSTSLDALPQLLEPILAGRADLVIGSRLISGARVTRGLKRECISRCYNLLLRTFLHLRVRDAQCGFKAIRARVARELLPSVRDEGWFFDTELLALAQRARFRTLEIPVAWTEDTDSTVKIASTAMTDLRGIARMLRSQPGAFTKSPQGDHHISAI
jgi:glycosyltransferase involved in cell wall biosynthesis